MQCNLTKINEIKVSSNPTTLFHHDKVFQATKRNVENIAKRKRYITENKLDKLFFDKYKRRRPRDNSIPTLSPRNLQNNIQQHNLPIQSPSNIISTDRQQNIQPISTTTATLHPLINNIPTSITNNSIPTATNIISSEGDPSSNLPAIPIVSSSSLSVNSTSTSAISAMSNSRTVTSRSLSNSTHNSTQRPPFFTATRLPLRTLIDNIRSATNNTNNVLAPIRSTSSIVSPTVSTSALSNSITNPTANSTYLPNLPNLPNLPSTTTNLPYTTANPNLTNYSRARNTSYACTLTTTTARMDPSRRICNILTPVTTNTITLDNFTTTNIPICLPSSTRESTPTPSDHPYSIVTRSRARQHRQ